MEELLRKLGLSEKEVKVYLCLLNLGASTIAQIVRNSGIKRATVYVQLDALRKRGLVSSFIKGKKRFFAIEPPDALFKMLEERQEEAQKLRKLLEKIVPQIESSFYLAKGKEVKVQILEGDEAVKFISQLKLRLAKGEEVLRFGVPSEKFWTGMAKYFEKMTEKRIKKGIKVRLIVPEGELSEAVRSRDKKELKQTRFLPLSEFQSNVVVDVWRNFVAYQFIGKKKLVLLLESAEIANFQRILFELVWSRAK